MIVNDCTKVSRLTICNKCSENIKGICFQCRLSHPDRECNIAYGVTLVKSHCPMNKWWKSCSLVWFKPPNNPSVTNYLPHHSTHIIPPPRSHASPWTHRLKQFQKVIADETITETFVVLPFDYILLQPTDIKNYLKPSYVLEFKETPSIVRATQNFLGRKPYNYTLNQPLVYHKILLQEMMAKAYPPYLVETLYHNLYRV